MIEWTYMALLKILAPVKSVLGAYGDLPTSGGNKGSGDRSFTLSNPLGPCDNLSCIANAITKALLDISIPIVAIMVLIGGFQILTAGGDPEKFKTGRKTIMYSVIGFAVILIADGVVSIIRNLLGG